MITPKPCRTCKAPVILVRKAEESTRWTVVEADPVQPSSVFDASTIRILRGDKTGYRLEHLREVLSMDLAFDGDTTQTPDDFPWHVVHRCESDNT